MTEGRKNKRSPMPEMTKRWFRSNLLWIVLLLVVAAVGGAYFARQSYYSSVSQALDYRMSTVMSNLPPYTVGANERRSKLMQLVSEYPEKEKFELMLLDKNGRAVITSSGFDLDADAHTDDFDTAMASEDGRGSFSGRSSQGENIASVTRLLTVAVGDVYAVRLTTSLEAVDSRVLTIALAMLMAVLTIIFFTYFSSTYFLRSLVRPIQKIEESARAIAGGDFNVRIDADYKDEIGELCDCINEMAQGLSETERMKNEFISSVSHELRTPLTSIKGWGETLMSVGREDSETYRKGLSIIISETSRLSNMVEDLLDFSRLQQNKGLSYKTQILDLVAELTEAVLTVNQRAKRAGIGIDYDEPLQTITIEGDSARIKQVFANVFDNALKYSGEGKKIGVNIEEKEGFAAVSISDSGIGIPVEDLPKLTTRFYKASNSTTGSGIGLSVVSEIMNLHGGRLDIESTLGVGTTVTLSFPLYGGQTEN